MSEGKFGKDIRLCSRQLMDQLFESGNSLKEFPIRLVWMPSENASAPPLQLAISVPKKKVPKAAHRNRIKRQMRAAFRQEQQAFLEQLDLKEQKIVCMLIYLGKNEIDYHFLEDKISVTLQRLLKEVCVN